MGNWRIERPQQKKWLLTTCIYDVSCLEATSPSVLIIKERKEGGLESLTGQRNLAQRKEDCDLIGD